MTTIFLGWQENKKVSRSKNETYTDDWAFWFISTLIRCLLGSLYGSSLGKVTDLCYRLGFSMLCEIWGNWCLEKTFWDTNSLFYLNTHEGGGWKRSLSWASRVQIQALQCIYLLQVIYLQFIYLLPDTLSKLASVKLKFLSRGMEILIVLPHWLKDWMNTICVLEQHSEQNKRM